MAIETVAGKPDIEKLLDDFQHTLGVDRETARVLVRIAASPDSDRAKDFLDETVGSNSETGFQKVCAKCNAWTGHYVLPGEAWYMERCLRCGSVSAYEVLLHHLQGVGKDIITDPRTDARSIDCMLLSVLGPEFYVYCFYAWYATQVRAAAKRALSGRAEPEVNLAEFSRL